jgi:hypothetical protein
VAGEDSHGVGQDHEGPSGEQVIETIDLQETSSQAQPRHRALGEGAGQAAPTAPHATQRAADAKRSGPERFWARWPGRVAMAVCLVVSAAGHGVVVPFEVPEGFEVKELEGEVAIPVDLLEDNAPPPAIVAASPPAARPDEEKEKQSAVATPAVPRPARREATLADAGVDASKDAAPVEGGTDGGAAPVGAAKDAGARDPEALIASDAVRADVNLVKLTINAEVIRAHPVGARLGELIRGIPQWDDFMGGTDLDPIRDFDWIIISGPSLVKSTAHDAVYVHYSVSDAVMDRAVRVVSGKYERGGPFDAGARGVKAMLARADRAERVILRPQPHLLAVVPPSVAQSSARVLSMGAISAHIHPGEAMNARLLNPHNAMPEIPESISELRARIIPRPDRGVDVLIEGDAKDASSAIDAAETLRRLFRRHNDAITSILTHGLLDHVEVSVQEGKVDVRVAATLDQIETLVTLVADFLGIPTSGSSVPGPSPSPSLPSKPRGPR